MTNISVAHVRGYAIKSIENEFKNSPVFTEGTPPTAALVGMIDKVYNLGMGKLTAPASVGGFPTFIKAFREKNYTLAAQESGNKPKEDQGGILKRNTLDYELFIKAAGEK
ncbi:MAG: hypothetical protein ChlgKO_14020 [Chlamydiales bacterium]